MICLISLQAWSQEDLDDVFDDGDKIGLDLKVGTNIITDLGGTLNLFVDLKPIDMFSIHAGIGVSPFPVIIDVMNFSSEVPVLDTSKTSAGLYYNAGFAFHPNMKRYLTNLDVYYYFDFQRWQFKAVDIVNVRRSKFNVGMGISYSLGTNMSLDFFYGIYTGSDKMYLDEDVISNDYIFVRGGSVPPTTNSVNEYKTRILGFDAGVTFNFNL